MEFTLKVAFNGMWIVTSPEIPGLLVAAGDVRDAIKDAARAIGDLALAAHLATASGEPIKSIFK